MNDVRASILYLMFYYATTSYRMYITMDGWNGSRNGIGVGVE